MFVRQRRHPQTRHTTTLKLGAKPSRDFDTDGERYWVGFDIPAKKAVTLRHLRKLAKPKGTLGWYGYQSGPGARSELALWIYAGSAKATKSTYSFLQNRLKTVPRGALSMEDSNCVAQLSPASNKMRGDKEWFEAVFAALQDR
jgi:hypothetical protein